MEPEKVSPPGVVQSRLQTLRAGRRRVGGLAVSTIRTALVREASSRLRLARGSGPRVRERPAVPRALDFKAAPFFKTRTLTRRENAEGCVLSFPSPACGRGWRAIERS